MALAPVTVKPFVTAVIHVMQMADNSMIEAAIVHPVKTLRDIAYVLQSHIAQLRAKGARRVVPVHVRVTEHLSVKLTIPSELLAQGAPAPEGQALLTSEPIRASKLYVFGKVLSSFEAQMNWPDFPEHLRGADRVIILPMGEVVPMQQDMAHFPFGVVDMEDPILGVDVEWMPWEDHVLHEGALADDSASAEPVGPQTSQVIPPIPVVEVSSKVGAYLAVVDGCNLLPSAGPEHRAGFDATMSEVSARLAELGMPDEQIEASLAPFRPIKFNTPDEFAYFQEEIKAGRARVVGDVEVDWVNRAKS